jgi:hypothetical protein
VTAATFLLHDEEHKVDVAQISDAFSAKMEN